MVSMKIITTIILILVTIIIIFSFVGNSSSDLIASANSITDANNCSDGTDTAGNTLAYNQSSKQCTNSTGNDIYLAGQIDLPLNTLFGSSGVIFLVLMAGLLLLIVGISFKMVKK